MRGRRRGGEAHSQLKVLVICRCQGTLLDISFVMTFSVLKNHLWYHPHLHKGVCRAFKKRRRALFGVTHLLLSFHQNVPSFLTPLSSFACDTRTTKAGISSTYLALIKSSPIVEVWG